MGEIRNISFSPISSASATPGGLSVQVHADAYMGRTAPQDVEVEVLSDTSDGLASASVTLHQDACPEYVDVSPQQSYSFGYQQGTTTLVGRSNASGLTFTTPPTSYLVLGGNYTVTKDDGTQVSVQNGSAISGDPGADGEYTFSFTFYRQENVLQQSRITTLTVASMEDSSVHVTLSAIQSYDASGESGGGGGGGDTPGGDDPQPSDYINADPVNAYITGFPSEASGLDAECSVEIDASVAWYVNEAPSDPVGSMYPIAWPDNSGDQLYLSEARGEAGTMFINISSDDNTTGVQRIISITLYAQDDPDVSAEFVLTQRATI